MLQILPVFGLLVFRPSLAQHLLGALLGGGYTVSSLIRASGRNIISASLYQLEISGLHALGLHALELSLLFQN
jgi:hypothetical protein